MAETKNPQTVIEWLDRATNPAPSGKTLLFLLVDARGRKLLCYGTVNTNVYGEPVWNDYTTCDGDGMPSEYPDYKISHWALLPEFIF